MNSRLPLRLKHVGMTYEGSPPVTVLHDVNLTLEAGSFSLLLGPSGSGKTTLLVLIGGVFAWRQTSKEELPAVTFDRVRISVRYPGAPAEDVEHFMPILERAIGMVPALESVGIRKFFNGPESFTPDVRYMLGEAP